MFKRIWSRITGTYLSTFVDTNLHVRRMASQTNIDESKFIDVKTLSKALPKDVRRMIRTNELADGQPTIGLCEGYTQANLTILHKSLADDFEKFCHANTGPLPLIYKSKTGEYTAPGLSHHESDIRSDVPMYNVLEHGKKSKAVGSLLQYEEEMKEMSTFYLGCSFSFDKALLEAGVPLRNVEQNCNVGMFKINTKCYPVGPFDCVHQVVSMKPIPRHQLELAFQITHPLEEVHGAPAHIGDPAMIGIADINDVDFGKAVKFHEGDVPVFWSCGVTGLMALEAVKSPLAFTHYPGSMYISDTPLKTHDLHSDPNKPKVIVLKEEPFFASAVAEPVLNQVKALEKSIQEDPGKRGISHLHIPDELIKSALSLSHASSVIVATGFPCMMDKTPPYENDGLSGAVAIATMLQALGKHVTIMVDSGMAKLMSDVIQALVSKGVISKTIEVTSFPPAGKDATKETAREFLSGPDDVHPKYQHLVAIERAGRADDKTWRTMKAKDMTSLISPIDLLFEAANEMPYVSTTGIGDGGNELGMGKVKDKVVEHINLGAEIACEVSADYLITAGVSDWGGYALSMALYAVSLCPIHDRYLRKNVGFPLHSEEKLVPALPTVEKQEAMLSVLKDHGIRDGVLGELSMSVDGIPFHPAHAEKLQQLSSKLIT